MNSPEVFFSAITSIFTSFMGSFSGGGSTTLLISFFLLTSSFPFLTILCLSKVGATAMVLVSGNIHRKRIYLSKKMILWAIFTSFLGISLGTFLAQFLLDITSLKLLVALTLCFIALYQLFFTQKKLHLERREEFSGTEYFWSGVLFLFVNILNAITGGMGLIFVTFYTGYLKMSYIQASAYSMIAGIPVLGAQVFYLLTQTHPPLMSVFAVAFGSMFGAYLGTHFQYHKGDLWVKRASGFMLIVIALFLFF